MGKRKEETPDIEENVMEEETPDIEENVMEEETSDTDNAIEDQFEIEELDLEAIEDIDTAKESLQETFNGLVSMANIAKELAEANEEFTNSTNELIEKIETLEAENEILKEQINNEPQKFEGEEQYQAEIARLTNRLNRARSNGAPSGMHRG